MNSRGCHPVASLFAAKDLCNSARICTDPSVRTERGPQDDTQEGCTLWLRILGTSIARRPRSVSA
jgi:hypothetical protein